MKDKLPIKALHFICHAVIKHCAAVQDCWYTDQQMHKHNTQTKLHQATLPLWKNYVWNSDFASFGEQ